MLNIFSFLILIIFSQITIAQNSEPVTDGKLDDEKWYQIELVVYANMNESSAGNELWDQELSLNYPDNSVLLINPFKENDSEYLPSSLEEVIFQTPNIPHDLPERPFTLLQPEDMQLLNAVKKIASQKDFRLLFHGAWRQFISPRDKSENIVITGGDQFDNHFELEGTIKLGVERYLHIETDLWLNTFTSNIGLLETPWQLLPRRPSAQKHPTDWQEKNTEPGFDPLSESQAQSLRSNRLTDSAQISEDALIELFGNQFSVERTVALRQKRRMRSNELHYLDHPLMGLLVKVTPYERPLPPIEDSPEEEERNYGEYNKNYKVIKNNNADSSSADSTVLTPPKPASQLLQEADEP